MVVQDFRQISLFLLMAMSATRPGPDMAMWIDVGSCHCVPACGIPNDESTLSLRSDGHFVRAFTIGGRQSLLF